MPRHDLDPLSLMAGIFFVGVALLGLLGQGTGDAAGWLWPALLIVVGLAGLLAARPRGGHPDPSASTQSAGGHSGGATDESGVDPGHERPGIVEHRQQPP